MAATPLPPTAAGENPEGNPVGGPPPGTDLTGISFRDQLWLNTYPLDRNLVFDYFALSPFYDPFYNNDLLRLRRFHLPGASACQRLGRVDNVIAMVAVPSGMPVIMDDKNASVASRAQSWVLLALEPNHGCFKATFYETVGYMLMSLVHHTTNPLDAFGEHAVHCRELPGFKYRHDFVRDVLYDVLRHLELL